MKFNNLDMMTLPKFLYRGDSDKKNDRNLKSTINHNQLHTNLLKGGFGEKIFKEEILNLVNAHIASKFDFTHFLSFTEDRNSAFRFGLNLHTSNESVIENCCEEVYNQNEEWDFAIIVIDTSKIQIIENPYPGIYKCIFKPQILMFREFEYYTIILIDAKIVLKDKFEMTAEYALFDKEWLLLPATLKLMNHNVLEYSAILDGGCISSISRYKADKDSLDDFNIIDY